jgi:copper resistance protein B
MSMSAAPSAAAPFGAPVDDEHVFYHLLFDQLEGRFGKETSFRWEGEGWAGTDTNRIVLKTQGEVTKGEIGDGDQELLYARPISTYFNLQGGLRYDLDSGPGRGWAAFGIEGLAPQFFHVTATGYIGDQGRFAAKLEGNYDLLLTQSLILQPQIEMNLYSKNDPGRKIGTGLAELDTGLRLRYEITRKFAPYIGLTYENKFGSTASRARSAGEEPSALRFSIGLRNWF